MNPPEAGWRGRISSPPRRVGPWACRSLGPVGLLLLAGCDLAPPRDAGRPVTEIRVGEGVLRRKAVAAPLPEYPSSALREGIQGVAVAGVKIGREGEVLAVEVLESPDEFTGRSLKQALEQWRFEPTTVQKRTVEVTGKLTFYFRIEGGLGRVMHPPAAPEPRGSR